MSALDTQVAGDHYKILGAYQPWEVAAYWLTPDELRGYMKGTVIAYFARERDKGGITDMRKAAHTFAIFEEMLPLCEAFHAQKNGLNATASEPTPEGVPAKATPTTPGKASALDEGLSDYANRHYTELARAINTMCQYVNDNAIAHGWWDAARNDGEMIALMHSELSEALEALRKEPPNSGSYSVMDSHLPKLPAIVVELADTVIRIMDFCQARGLNLGQAIVAKHEYNVARMYKHGGKKF